ncbi:hypothetical protein N8388_00920 [Octadecabacter sp.]|nr:hypothetical protein [Octadecabacter sp.]
MANNRRLIWFCHPAQLDACQAKHADKDARIAAMQADIDTAAPAPVTAAVAAPATDFDGDGVVECTDEGVKPRTLDAPLDGMADDLKKIKGIGAKMKALCNRLGFWHFDQIANWTDDEVAWVDANLEGFKGRVIRDDWVAQAKLLAAGGETAFSKRVDGGDVY